VTDMAENRAPRFQIEVVHNRKITETVRKRNLHKNDVESEYHGANFVEEVVTRTVPESYMVYFPSGHSLWFETKAQMAQAGLVEGSDFEVDLDTGLPVDPKTVINLKAHVEKNTRRASRQFRMEA